MQAQARSISASVTTAKRLYSEFLESHPDVFVPPGMDCQISLSYMHSTLCILYKDSHSIGLYFVTYYLPA